MKSRTIIGALVLSVTLAFAAQEAHTLARKAKVGQEFRSTQQVTIKEEAEITITSSLTEKITQVDADGSTTSRVTDKTLKIRNGSEDEIDLSGEKGSESVSEATVNALGITTSYKEVDGGSEEENPEHMRVSNVSGLIFPDKAVKKGDTWSHEFDAIKKGNVPASRISFEVVGDEVWDGKACLKLKYSAKETEGDKPLEASGIMIVRLEDGLTVKYDAEVKNFPVDDETHVDAHVVVQLEK